MQTSKNFNGYYVYRPSTWIMAEGEEAHEFLQSQFSNDLGGLKVGEICYGLWLDQKGKVHGDSFVLRVDEETFYLFSYATPESLILDKLNSFIVADDVVLVGKAEEMAAVSFFGDTCQLVSECEIDSGLVSRITFNDESFWAFPGRRGDGFAFELVGSNRGIEQFIERFQGMAEATTKLREEDVEFVRILSRCPKIPIDVGAKDLPQEGGLETDAVSFNKGCYLGQEVMSRLHSMGLVRRGLRLLRSDVPFEYGKELYLEGKKVGILKSAVSKDGVHYFLGLVSNTVPAEATLSVLGSDSNVFSVSL